MEHVLHALPALQLLSPMMRLISLSPRLLNIVRYSTSSATQHRRLLNIVGYSTSSDTRPRQPCQQSK
jgi:hypothetical protein